MNKLIPLLICSAVIFGLVACEDSVTELTTPVYDTGLASTELRNSVFESVFPAQFASFMQNSGPEVMTVYKGSVPYRKNDNVNPLPLGFEHAQPYLKNLWLGYPFMYEYNETRGHTRAIEDFTHIDRINSYSETGGLPATCWNCKTPKMMEWIDRYGDDFWAMDVNGFREEMDYDEYTIGCANCHNPANMELRLYSEPLKSWLERSGRDLDQISRNEMRSLVCAQCHVEYYFTDPGQGPSKRPVFPWDNGFDPEQIFAYYKGHGDGQIPGFEGQFTDWVHPVSGTPMLKMQHPEYETWINGPHGAAGVSCADCHMSYTLSVDRQKISSHWWTSPLKDPELRACRTCHSDKTAEYLTERVLSTQEKTFRQLILAQEYSVRAHEAVRLASEYVGYKAPNYDELMILARDNVRKGQMFWDYVSAENSFGFHNPAKALDTLMTSMESSQQAINYASAATNFSIAAQLNGDIHELVPPILELSRKLQQDPEFLQTHEWLQYLSVLPEAERVWDGLTRLR